MASTPVAPPVTAPRGGLLDQLLAHADLSGARLHVEIGEAAERGAVTQCLDTGDQVADHRAVDRADQHEGALVGQVVGEGWPGRALELAHRPHPSAGVVCSATASRGQLGHAGQVVRRRRAGRLVHRSALGLGDAAEHGPPAAVGFLEQDLELGVGQALEPAHHL